MIHTIGYAAKHSQSSLKPYEFDREEPLANEVQIDIEFCGVCHSDVHQAKNEWHNTLYPCMPGHEIIGRVVKAGTHVTKFKVGDRVGVGCMIDSCKECESCKEGLEQYCEKGFLATYNGNQRTPKEDNHTYGGYSDTIVVREDFVLRIPENLESSVAAPILCAGVTTYSPLRHWGVKAGMKVGIIGFGGLGDMAIKLATALGADVTLITTSKEKEKDARKIGAKNVIISTDKEQMKTNKSTLDFILSTIPEGHDPNGYAELLKRDGTMTIVGCFMPIKVEMQKLLTDRRSIGTSLIGGIAETQEVLDFCSKHGIGPDIKVIGVDGLNDAFAKIDKGEIDYRFVIDMSTIKEKKKQLGMIEKLFAHSHEETSHKKYEDDVH